MENARVGQATSSKEIFLEEVEPKWHESKKN
jgi:hypothetical protein